MTDGRVQIWLEKKLAREARENVLLALALAVGAAAVLAFTFAGAYAMSMLVLFPVLHANSTVSFWLAAAIVVVLFVANARVNRDKLTEYRVESMDGGPVYTFYVPYVGMVSNLNPFNPTNARAGIKMLADIVLTGPRLASAAWHALRRSGRLRRMDTPTLAAVFTLLLSAGRRVGLAEILPQLGHCDPSAVFQQLHEIEGVVFLSLPPPAISLTADLRREFFEEFSREQ